MEETISLKELIDTLKKRLVMIITITLMAVAASAIVSYFVLTPTYESRTQVLISQAATGASILSSANPFDSDQRYINTYNVILQSPYIMDQVEEELGLSSTPNLRVNQEGDSQVVTLTVEDTDPVRAVETANVTAEVFRNEITTLLNIDNIHILSPAELSDSVSPVSPNPQLNMAIAFVVGLMAAVGLAFLLEFLDNSIRNEQDIESTLGLPVLGAITIMDEEEERVDDRVTRRNDESELPSRNRKGSENVGS